eukprot:scaffold56973_cov16-Tisochrysis_lutea.AAC.1
MVHLTACTLLLLSPLVGKLMPDEYKCYGSTASSPLHICRMTQVPCVDSAMCHVPCVDSAMCHVPCVDSAMCHVPCVDVPCGAKDGDLAETFQKVAGFYIHFADEKMWGMGFKVPGL